MKHTFFLIASGAGTGLTSVSLGVFRALDRRGIRVGFCKPISQSVKSGGEPDTLTGFIGRTTGFHPAEPIPFDEAENYVREGRIEELMERVVEKAHRDASEIDVMIVEGLLTTKSQSFSNRINNAVVAALSAEIILVNSSGLDPEDPLEESLKLTSALYGGWDNPNLIGCILNKVRIQDDGDPGATVPVASEPVEVVSADPDAAHAALKELRENILSRSSIFQPDGFELLGCIPWNPDLPSVRVSDVAQQLNATVINAGDMKHRRVKTVYLCARQISHILHLLRAGALLVTPRDRLDVVLAAAVVTMNRIRLAGIVVTGGDIEDQLLLDLCRPALELGLPVLSVPTDSFATATALSRISNEIPADDDERLNVTLDFIARRIDVKKLESRIETELDFRMSPAAFRYQLSKRAREANKRIVLPEGNEPRTIAAAATCQRRGLARCVLLGNPDEIHRIAELQHVILGDVEIIDPAGIRDNYFEPLMEMRKHKNMTARQAREALEDNIMVGTLMLAADEVDGLVSGAVHSSAHTIRPALQLIKTKPSAKAVSSVFFMCLPEQVVVYGDCAVIPDPDAETLADIAVQSAASAEQFGIPPRVALISYSTGDSGTGAGVDKVRFATAIAQDRRDDIPIDGPLQYDAAAIASVAAQKAPDSPVAGRATVFIFPDLNTGNTTYKAVQRSANVISIGPVLQGMRKPVNDLSRGALVEDIVYTIAITGVQAEQQDMPD